jgi:uncharacterized protein YdaU (DUF1376 family)
MALRDQPFLPLYIKDFMTDEKLAECSPAAHGIYVRLICILHKEEVYGRTTLKEKYKTGGDILSDFSEQFSTNMPFKTAAIYDGLKELFSEGVIQVRGNKLSQKRMVKDGELSEKRSKSGKTGGSKTSEKNKKLAETFATANSIANTANENAIENIDSKVDIGVDENFEKEILGLWNYTENTHNRYYRIFRQAYRMFDLIGKLDHFKTQCRNYKAFTELNGIQYRKSFENFIGDPAQSFDNGYWNAEVWSEKIKAIAIQQQPEKPVHVAQPKKKDYSSLPK